MMNFCEAAISAGENVILRIFQIEKNMTTFYVFWNGVSKSKKSL